jgi:hypothetical protein
MTIRHVVHKAGTIAYYNRDHKRTGGPKDRYARIPSSSEQLGDYTEKKVAEDVYLVKYSSFDYEMLVHHCEGKQYYKEMTFRENEDGPMYWCEGCGYVIDNGTAMAIRLYEAPFA